MVKVYLVGGAVRDELLGLASKDLDLVVTGLDSFQDLLDYLAKNDYNVFQANEQFFTVRARHPQLGAVDISLPRAEEGYSDQRRPDKVSLACLEADLSRRDFTINAIAKELATGKIIDPLRGQEDLKYSFLRAVGDPCERFSEDGLRVLRALRFYVTRGFKPTECLREAIHIFHPEEGLKGVARERMRDELAKMFATCGVESVRVLNQFPSLRDYLLSKVGLQPTLGKVKP